MQPDPDLQRGQGVYGAPQPQNTYPAQGIYSNPPPQQPGGYAEGFGGPRTTTGIMLMAIFSALNIIFLLVAALYSLGLLANDEASSDGASFFVVMLMTLLAGGLALSASYIGMRLSKQSNSFGFLKIHKIMFVTVIVLSVAVMVGPLFNK